MSRSTGKFISYDLRPTKQSERLILVDILKAASDSGLPISEYRYVGMGANRFYDFLLMHRYLGISNMVSLEHDKKFVERAKFNAPFRFITVENSSAEEFIAKDASECPSIFWMDYDGGIGPEIVGDIRALAAKSKLGDFVFVTVCGHPPRVIDQVKDSVRFEWLKETFGDIAGTVEMEDVESSTFREAVYKILCAAFRNAFAARKDGKFVSLIQVEYADSMTMITMGGAFLTEGQSIGVKKKVKRAVPFLPDGEKKYNIRSMHITERERALFDLAVTSKRRVNSEFNRLKRLGFKESEIEAYKDLLRYLPRYVESIV